MAKFIIIFFLVSFGFLANAGGDKDEGGNFVFKMPSKEQLTQIGEALARNPELSKSVSACTRNIFPQSLESFRALNLFQSRRNLASAWSESVLDPNSVEEYKRLTSSCPCGGGEKCFLH